jgi:hypothetical protein
MAKNIPEVVEIDKENPECLMEEFEKIILYFKNEIDEAKDKILEVEEKLHFLEDFSIEVREILDNSYDDKD